MDLALFVQKFIRKDRYSYLLSKEVGSSQEYLLRISRNCRRVAYMAEIVKPICSNAFSMKIINFYLEGRYE